MITLDFETRSTIDIKLGATRYSLPIAADGEITQALCMSWVYDDEDEVYLWHRGHDWIEKSERPAELIERIASGEIVEAHNAYFEYVIWNNVLRREFPEFDTPLDRDQMRCSAAKASCLSLPRALGEALIAIGAPQEYWKLADGKRLINKLSKPRPRRKDTPWPQWCDEEDEHRRNWEYNMQDVRAERYLSKWLPEMSEREIEYWKMDWRMNERGVLLDSAGVKRAIHICDAETARLNAEMFELTGGEVESGSKRKQFRTWVNKQLATLEACGYEAGQLPDTQANTLSFALEGVPVKAGDAARAAIKPTMDAKWAQWGELGKPIRRAMEICMEVNKTSNSKYRQMEACVCSDGRAHDIMLYNGADRTGRWAGRGLQPHNFVRGYSKDMPNVWEDILKATNSYGWSDYEILPFIWGDPLPVMAKACRGALVASPGKELLGADFNAIEARKLAWMANCLSQLTLFRTPGGDPYVAMARAIYGHDWLDITDKDAVKAYKKEHADERNLGKRAVLGLGYAMGWEKFQLTVWAEEGIWLEDEFCQKIVGIYRKKQCPEVPALWKAVESAAISAVLDPGGEYSAGGDDLGIGSIQYFLNERLPFLHCRLPSGRLLAYYKPEVHTKITWRFNATNERGKPCIVSFPAKIGVALNRVKWHAEKLAEKQRKKLTSDEPENFRSPHLSFMGRNIITKKWQRCGTHGGSLVENADQASSRDLLAEAMYRVDRDGRFDLLLSIHDEVISESPIGACPVAEYEKLMAEVPEWALGMPIAAEGFSGPRLRK